MLYLGEFVGLLFIWAGYAACVRPVPIFEPKRTPAALQLRK